MYILYECDFPRPATCAGGSGVGSVVVIIPIITSKCPGVQDNNSLYLLASLSTPYSVAADGCDA